MAKNKKNKIKHSVRYLAMEIVEAVENDGAYSNLLLHATIEKKQLNEKDAGLLTGLVYGVLQRKMTLDYGLSAYIRAPKKLESWVRSLLRVSVYQMAYLDKIPDHAILYDAVEIAKYKGHTGIAKLVNGILRNVQRNGLKEWQEISDPIEKISVGASIPVWIVKKLTEQLGIAKTEEIAFSLLQNPYISIRVQNAEKIGIEETLHQLEEEGILVEKSPLSPSGLRLLSGKAAGNKLFQAGKITIQDESSQLVALFGKISPADQILDACAAPGGKTVHMASFLEKAAGGKVFALDVHEHKIGLIEQNADRMKVTDRIQSQLLDAKKAAEIFKPETFDVIFVDAPCSGLGLMRRKPEIKYALHPPDIQALQEEQKEILKAVEPLLKKGGRLVYSTCTITQEENQDTIKKFLESHPYMAVIPADSKTATENQDGFPEKIVTPEGYVEIFPDDFGTDGFFICAMEKQEESDRGDE